jgi:hypothetical protein
MSSSTGDNDNTGIAPPAIEKVIREPMEAGADEKNAFSNTGNEGKERMYALMASNKFLNKHNSIRSSNALISKAVLFEFSPHKI